MALENQTSTKMRGLNVLLAGGTGFAGVHVSKALIREGCNVYVIARDKQKLVSVLGSDDANQVQLLQADLLIPPDLDRLRNQLARIGPLHAVIHMVGGGP